MTKSEKKTLWQKEKLHVLCNLFFCHYVFKKLSAAEASESVCMRERVCRLSSFHKMSVFIGSVISVMENEQHAHKHYPSLTALNRNY